MRKESRQEHGVRPAEANRQETGGDATKRTILAAAAVLLIAGAVLAGWQVSRTDKAGHSMAQPDISAVSDGAAIVEVQLPAELSPDAQMGKRAFEARCAECHGQNAAGRKGEGPPLVHKIYEPSHHGDAAFQRAAQNGVQSHHWQFGNMPPVEGLNRASVIYITAYVRELQRANGIR